MLVGEALVLVRVDLDVVRCRVPEHAEQPARAGRVAVAVDVVADLTAEPRVAFVEHPEAERPGGRGGVGDAADRERRAVDLRAAC